MRDLSIMIDNIKLNIRVGVIFKYRNEVLIEISKIGENSVIPGGRVKVNEETKMALKREIQEEMHYNLEIDKLKFVKVLENFFTIGDMPVHELFFVYQYKMLKKDYEALLKIKDNHDNNNTSFAFVSIDDLSKINLLPTNLIDLIKKH